MNPGLRYRCHIYHANVSQCTVRLHDPLDP